MFTNRMGRSQSRKNKIMLSNFNDETYIKLKPEIQTLECKYKDDTFSRIFYEICEKWALEQERAENICNEKNTLIQEIKIIENKKKDIQNKNHQLEERINHLLGEYNDQRTKTDEEIKDKNVRINSMEKYLKETKTRESEYHEQMDKQGKELAKFKTLNNTQNETIKKLKLVIEDNQDTTQLLLQETNKLNYTISMLEKTIEMLKRDHTIEETLTDNSIIDLNDTTTSESILQFTNSFSITHNEKTIQQEFEDIGYQNEQNSLKNKTQEQQTRITTQTNERHDNSKNTDSNETQRKKTKQGPDNTNKTYKNNTLNKDIKNKSNENTPNKTPGKEQYDNLKNKLEQLEEKIKQNTHNIKNIENNMSKTTNHQKNYDQDKNTTEKINCYIVGDSHLKYVEQEIKNTEWTRKFNPKINVMPGCQLQDITNKLIPKNLQKKDILVISGGTNDLYHTSTPEIKKQINNIGKIGCPTFIITIPPQKYHNTKHNILGLNTIIKYECDKYKNLFLINTHKFVKAHHLSKDGIHLGENANNWLSHKIMKTIENYNAKPYIKREKNTQTNLRQHTIRVHNVSQENSYRPKRNTWTTYENPKNKNSYNNSELTNYKNKQNLTTILYHSKNKPETQKINLNSKDKTQKEHTKTTTKKIQTNPTQERNKQNQQYVEDPNKTPNQTEITTESKRQNKVPTNPNPFYRNTHYPNHISQQFEIPTTPYPNIFPTWNNTPQYDPNNQYYIPPKTLATNSITPHWHQLQYNQHKHFFPHPTQFIPNI